MNTPWESRPWSSTLSRTRVYRAHTNDKWYYSITRWAAVVSIQCLRFVYWLRVICISCIIVTDWWGRRNLIAYDLEIRSRTHRKRSTSLELTFNLLVCRSSSYVVLVEIIKQRYCAQHGYGFQCRWTWTRDEHLMFSCRSKWSRRLQGGQGHCDLTLWVGHFSFCSLYGYGRDRCCWRCVR